MGYYIGIDGGGTKTHGLISVNDKLLTEATVGPTNYHSIGLGSMKYNLQKLIYELTDKSEITLDEVESICMGAAGVDCAEDRLIVEKSFRDLGYKGKINIVNDGLIALVGANSGYEGGLIISGTGSIAMGITDEGQISRVGGWGHLFDDLGSGYSIGKCAVSEVFKSFDNRGENTVLTESVLNHFKVNDVPDLIPILYDKNMDKSIIAGLAEIVLENTTDIVCDKIIQKNVNDLVLMVEALSKNINSKTFRLSVSGSLLVESQYFLDYFKNELDKILPSIEVKVPDMTAARGALLIARS